MSTRIVVLFGGGDGGGLVITDNGVRPIPPFDPGILRTARAASAMVHATRTAPNERIREKMGKIAQNLSNLAVEMIEDAVGELDAERGLIYQDDDGGFSCGSTGKPPVPVPWPPTSFGSVADMVAAGAIDSDLVGLVKTAHDKGIPFSNVIDKPADVAKQLGLPLSQKSAADLGRLAPANLTKVKDPVDREIIQLFQTVVKDGRYMNTWYKNPAEVASTLSVSISDGAIARLIAGGAASYVTGIGGGLGDVADGEIAAGIAWAGICIVVGIVLGANDRPLEQIIQDRSLTEKF